MKRPNPLPHMGVRAFQTASFTDSGVSYGTEGENGLYETGRVYVDLAFIKIQHSIHAAERRNLKARINGSKGGSPVRFSKRLMVELAKRGFDSAEKLAHYLQCAPITVLRKLSDKELQEIHSRYL